MRHPVTLGGDTYDDAYTLDPKRGERAARLIDPQLKMALELRAAPIFRDLGGVSRRRRPMSSRWSPTPAVPNAFNLAAKGIDAGMLELQPGARFEASFEIRLSEIRP